MRQENFTPIYINYIHPQGLDSLTRCHYIRSSFDKETMAKLDKVIDQAQTIVGSGLSFERLDQIFDLQRLLGPVIAYKRLLEITMNSIDVKEQRLAASKLLDAAGEEPEKIAERLRASIFHDLTLDQLELIVQTGITDPEEALKEVKRVSSE